MMEDPIRSATEIIGAITSIGTFMVLIYAMIQARPVVQKVDLVHEKIAELVEHTNSLTDKLMEKTDIAARAEGVKEGISLTLSGTGDAQAAALAKEAASAASKIIRVAAEQAADLLAQAAADAKRARDH